MLRGKKDFCGKPTFFSFVSILSEETNLEKTGNKFDEMQMERDEKYKAFKWWFYLEKYLLTLNIPIFKTSSEHQKETKGMSKSLKFRW